MSFYKKIKNGEDTDFNEETQLEEQYQKMFKKIARDFVHIDDLKEILRNTIEDLFDQGVFVNRNAYLKAKEYERNLDRKLEDRVKYKDVDDLIILDIERK